MNEGPSSARALMFWADLSDAAECHEAEGQ